MKGTDHSKRTIQMYLGTACRGRCVFAKNYYMYSHIQKFEELT